MNRPLGFELKVFPEPEPVSAILKDVPSVRVALFGTGVPKGFIGRRYSADATVTLIPREGGGPLLRFGSSGLGHAICVDIATGHVISVISAPGAEPLFVNTSIEQFTRTIKAMADRFPYYGELATDEEIDLVADELLDVIRGIDEAAAVPDKYWSTFVDDVRIGDLSTEAVLAVET